MGLRCGTHVVWDLQNNMGAGPRIIPPSLKNKSLLLSGLSAGSLHNFWIMNFLRVFQWDNSSRLKTLFSKITEEKFDFPKNIFKNIFLGVEQK